MERGPGGGRGDCQGSPLAAEVDSESREDAAMMVAAITSRNSVHEGLGENDRVSGFCLK